MNSTRNIMALIETLLADGDEIGVRELGARTGIPKSTVQRFLSAMEDNGWVIQDKRTQGYRIGYKLLGQSNGWALRLALVNQSQDLLKSLCKRTQHSAVLSTLDGYQAAWIAISAPENSNFALTRPKMYDLHTSAAGKVLLAWAPEPLRKYILYSNLRSYASQTITDPQKLFEELERIRADHYARSLNESVEGGAEIAVPLLNPDDSVLAALSIAGEKTNFADHCDEYLTMLRDAAEELSERLRNL